jgi:hypothetical protein
MGSYSLAEELYYSLPDEEREARRLERMEQHRAWERRRRQRDASRAARS